MAMCVMAVVAVAPCQGFSPGGNQITSPGRISSIGPPQRWARPLPAVTMSVWPSGCVCHAVRAPGSNVTLAPTTRAGSAGSSSGSMRTEPVQLRGTRDGNHPRLLREDPREGDLSRRCLLALSDRAEQIDQSLVGLA